MMSQPHSVQSGFRKCSVSQGSGFIIDGLVTIQHRLNKAQLGFRQVTQFSEGSVRVRYGLSDGSVRLPSGVHQGSIRVQ